MELLKEDNMETQQKGRRLLEIAVVFFWASEYCHAPYFTPYLTSLQISATLVGVIVSCYGFTQMLVRIPLGMATDTTGAYKTIITLGLACTTVSSLGLFLTTNLAGIFFFRILAGVAASTWIATTVVYMAMYPAEKSVTASARLNALNNSGKLLAFVLGGLAATLVSYRVTLFMSFAVGLVGLLCMPFVKVPKISRTPASLGRLAALITTPGILGPALLMAVQQMILHATVFSFTSNIAESRGAAPWMLSLLSAVFTAVQIASAKVIGSAGFQRLGRRPAILGGFALQFVYLAVLGLASSPWVILAGQIICAFGGAVLASLLLAECVKGVSQGERSTVVGIYQAVYGIGMTIGPACMGRWMENHSVNFACFMLLALCILLVAVIASLSWRDKK